MRFLSEESIRNIAVGASFYGAGGGGNPYNGLLSTIQTIKKYGPAKLVSVDELADGDWFISTAGMGAPSVGVEKIGQGDEHVRLFKKMGQYLGKKLVGTFPIEAGGGNSLAPIALASQLSVPVIDCDTMGRAFPEIEMTTLHVGGVRSTPLGLTDEKGNISIIESIDDDWGEKLSRTATVAMGATAAVTLYPAQGKDLKKYTVTGIITKCEQVGELLRKGSSDTEKLFSDLLEISGGSALFEGKISDLERKTEKGFNFGKVSMSGIHNNQGEDSEVNFQNENIFFKEGNLIKAMVPDLVILLDFDTLQPVTTDALHYGKRVRVVAVPADDKWHTDKGLETAGPRKFGYDFDYHPIQKERK